MTLTGLEVPALPTASAAGPATGTAVMAFLPGAAACTPAGRTAPGRPAPPVVPARPAGPPPAAPRRGAPAAWPRPSPAHLPMETRCRAGPGAATLARPGAPPAARGRPPARLW